MLIATQSQFFRSLGNRVVTATVTPLISLLFGALTAHALSRGPFYSGDTTSLWSLFTHMAPPVAFAIPPSLLYRYLGLIDSLTGLIIAEVFSREGSARGVSARIVFCAKGQANPRGGALT